MAEDAIRPVGVTGQDTAGADGASGARVRPGAGATPGAAKAVGVVGRAGSFEVLRGLGALGIVMFHLRSPGAQIGYAALPMFIYISVYFALRHGMAQPLGKFVRSRVDRLLVPWAFWSVVYVGLKIAQAQLDNRPLSSEFAWWQAVTGPAIHLWFLPFIAVVSIGLRLVWHRIARLNAHAVLAIALVLSAGLLAAADRTRFGPPLAQWVFGMIPVLMAVSEVRLVDESLPGRSLAVFLPWAALLLGLLALGAGTSALPLFIAMALIAGAGAVRIPHSPAIRTAAELSLGVYILHPIVAALIKHFGADPWDGSLSMLITVAALSLLATALMQKTPFARRFV